MAGILFTSREWGNFGLRLNDSESKVLSLREELRKKASLNKIVFMNQTHSNTASVVAGDEEIIDADAIVTTQKSVGLAVLVGDCVPILIRSNSAVAAIHAGRVGMTNGIVKKTLQEMRNLGAHSFEAILGPSICVDCYQVSADMYQEITEKFPAAQSTPEKRALDLQSGLAAQLTSEGIEVLNLGICTREHEDFFSHRRSQVNLEPEGRQVGLVYL